MMRSMLTFSLLQIAIAIAVLRWGRKSPKRPDRPAGLRIVGGRD